MKRLIAVLALLLILPAFMWSQAASARVVYLDGDDHPWGEEEGNDEPGRHRHTNSEEADVALCGYLPTDIIVNSQILYDDLRTIVFGPNQIKTNYPSENNSYLNRTRKASLK